MKKETENRIRQILANVKDKDKPRKIINLLKAQEKEIEGKADKYYQNIVKNYKSNMKK